MSRHLRGATRRYFRDRERVLGRRLWVSQDPDLAAEQLATYLGGVGLARKWAADLAAALERRA